MLKKLKILAQTVISYKEQLNRIDQKADISLTRSDAAEDKLVRIEKMTRDLKESLDGLAPHVATQMTAHDWLNAQRKSEIRLVGLLSRALVARENKISASPQPIAVDFREVLEEFKVLNPALFPVWHRLFENGAKAYAETKVGNCSHNELEPALLFRDVIDSFGRGTVLDVGCGPYDVPSYLMSFDRAAICGLEPLPLLTTPSYRVERGFGERIPWQDASFDTVVSGAALDHAFSVNRTLSEIKRVLKPRGQFFLWIASIPEAEEFIEDKTKYIAIDDFHIFHFDQKWLDPKLDEFFKRKEKFIIQDGWYHHVFYVMESI